MRSQWTQAEVTLSRRGRRRLEGKLKGGRRVRSWLRMCRLQLCWAGAAGVGLIASTLLKGTINIFVFSSNEHNRKTRRARLHEDGRTFLTGRCRLRRGVVDCVGRQFWASPLYVITSSKRADTGWVFGEEREGREGGEGGGGGGGLHLHKGQAQVEQAQGAFALGVRQVRLQQRRHRGCQRCAAQDDEVARQHHVHQVLHRHKMVMHQTSAQRLVRREKFPQSVE